MRASIGLAARILIAWLICMTCGGVALASGTILIFGDSLSAAYGMPERYGWASLLAERLKRERPAYSVVNASISGETTAGGLARIGKVLERSRPAVVVLELGANDGLRGLPVAAMKKNLSAMVEQSVNSGARVLVIGMRLPPNYGVDYTRAFERAYVDVARTHRAALLPFLLEGFADQTEMFQPDRIHPTEAAQPVVLKNVWGALAPLLGK